MGDYLNCWEHQMQQQTQNMQMMMTMNVENVDDKNNDDEVKDD